MPWFKPKPPPVFYSPMWIDGEYVIISVENMFVSCRGEDIRFDDRMILRFLGLLVHFYDKRDMLDDSPEGIDATGVTTDHRYLRLKLRPSYPAEMAYGPVQDCWRQATSREIDWRQNEAAPETAPVPPRTQEGS